MDLGLRALDEVLDTADASLTKGESAAGKAWPTGFSPLDAYLSGGVRSGELVLVGGPQGFGKTTWVLQVLRNIVAGGDHGVYFSYEHDEYTDSRAAAGSRGGPDLRRRGRGPAPHPVRARGGRRPR